MAATTPTPYRPRVSEEIRKKLTREANSLTSLDAKALSFEQRLQIVLQDYERLQMR